MQRAGLYAIDHSDPFDRMMADQAEVEDLSLATNDRWFADFGTRVVW
jgi:PIN domain nuclease of toxin-antitoxin system